MAAAGEDRTALKAKVAEIAEKYRANIFAMDSRELLDEFERRALLANYGYQDPTTAMMLKEAKAELLRRTKSYESAQSTASGSEAEVKRASQRPTLFG